MGPIISNFMDVFVGCIAVTSLIPNAPYCKQTMEDTDQTPDSVLSDTSTPCIPLSNYTDTNLLVLKLWVCGTTKAFACAVLFWCLFSFEKMDNVFNFWSFSNLARLYSSVINMFLISLDTLSTSLWKNNWIATCDLQQCDMLTRVDTDEPVQSSFKLRNSKWCSVSSLTFIDYSSEKQRLWSDCE